MTGTIEFDVEGRLMRITLNEAAIRVKEMVKALRALVNEVEIKLGVT